MTFEAFLKGVGQNIAKYRKLKPATQRDVANEAGISYRYYQSIESGAANITMFTMFRLATHLGIKPIDLIPTTTTPQ